MLAVLVEVLVVPVFVEGVLVAEVMVVAVAVAGRTVAPGAVFFFKMSAAPKRVEPELVKSSAMSTRAPSGSSPARICVTPSASRYRSSSF